VTSCGDGDGDGFLLGLARSIQRAVVGVASRRVFDGGSIRCGKRQSRGMAVGKKREISLRRRTQQRDKGAVVAHVGGEQNRGCGGDMVGGAVSLLDPVGMKPGARGRWHQRSSRLMWHWASSKLGSFSPIRAAAQYSSQQTD
jgi:hypothetical protein